MKYNSTIFSGIKAGNIILKKRDDWYCAYLGIVDLDCLGNCLDELMALGDVSLFAISKLGIYFIDNKSVRRK